MYVIRVHKCKQQIKNQSKINQKDKKGLLVYFKVKIVYFILRCKWAFAFLKDGDILCRTYQNIVDFLLKSQITVSTTYIYITAKIFEIPNTKLILIKMLKSHFNKWQLL